MGKMTPMRGLSPTDPEAARRAVAAHADFVVALYGGQRIELGDGLAVLFNPFVADSDWNLGIGLHHKQKNLDSALDRFRGELEPRARRLAILLDSRHPSDLGRFPSDRWDVAFRFSGLIYPAHLPSPEPSFPEGAAVLDVGSAGREADEVVAVFEAAFGQSAEHGLDPGYRRAIPAGLERSHRRVSNDSGVPFVCSTLVRLGDQAAAIGGRVQSAGVAGLYNLGVAPQFRNFGLGGAITRLRVAQARRDGAEVVYLLTEDPRVEASQIRRGFEPCFELVGMVERGTHHVSPSRRETAPEN